MTRKICFITTAPNGGGKQTFVDFGLKVVLDGTVHHLSTGHEMREEEKAGTELGKELAKYTSKRLFVPNSLVGQVSDKWFTKNHSPNITVLDGVPRRPDQNPIVIDFIKRHKMKGVIVDIQTPEQECFDRLMLNKRGRSDDGDETKVRLALEQWREFTVPAIAELCRIAPELDIDIVRCDGTHMERDAHRYAMGLATFYGLPIRS